MGFIIHFRSSMKQKVSTGFAVSIIFILAAFLGGIFWMMGRQKAADTPVAVVQDMPQASDASAKQAEDKAAREKKIIELSAKWSSFGVGEWSDHELFDTGISAISPVKSDIVHYVPNSKWSADAVPIYAGVESMHGSLSVDHKNTKLYGSADVTVFDKKLASGDDLEQFIVAQGKAIHENYCKKFGNDDMRYEDGKCHTEISNVKKLSDTMIVWNENFIGSPDILSVALSDGSILNLQSGQDSSSETDWMAFLQDIAATAQVGVITSNNQSVQSGKVSYENKEFGFSLELPASWKEYKVFVKEWDADVTSIDVSLPTSDIENTPSTPGYSSVMALRVQSMKSWDEMIGSEECKENPKSPMIGCFSDQDVVGRTDKYVITGQGPQWLPDDVNPLIPQECRFPDAAGAHSYTDCLKTGFKSL